MSSLRKSVGDIEKKLRGLKGGNADQGLLDRCVEELNTLRAEFEAFRDQAN